MFSKLWSLLKEIHYGQRGGTGTAVATGDIITAAKMNLKLEDVDDDDVTKTEARTYGVDATGQDVTWYTDTSSVYMKLDVSEESLIFTDDFYVKFGTGSDVLVYWDGDNLYFMPKTDDTGAIIIGDGTNKSMDFKWFGTAAAKYVVFDLGDDKIILEGIDLHLKDTDFLIFGDGSDILVDWTGALFLIIPATNDTGAINIGNGTVDIDLKIFLGTTNEYVEFNVGDSKTNFVGNASTVISVTSGLTGDTADNAVEIAVTDTQTTTSGISRGLYISYTSNGIKGDGEVNGMGIDLTISQNITGYAYGLALYTVGSGDPDISFLSALSIYADDVGSGTVSGFVCIDVGKTSAHKGTTRDAFMRFRTHSGTTDSVFLVEGSNMADYLFNWSSGVGSPHEGGDITDGKACSGGLRCNINGVVGVIPLYED